MNNTNTNAVRNTIELVNAAVLALKVSGQTEAQIKPQLPYLAAEAVKYIAAK